MTDRVYPAAKPLNPPPAAAMNGGATTTGPAKTTQLYNPSRPRPPMYRPQPNNQRSRRRSCTCRRCCCLCFIYTLIVLLSLILIAAIAASIFYLLYHPKHPTFTVTSAAISAFNLSSSGPSGFSHVTSRLQVTLSAKNPNSKKLTYLYDPITVSLRSGSVDLGNGTLPGFTHVAGNTTILKATVSSDPKRDLDSDSIEPLKSDMGRKNGFPLVVEANTKVQIQMGKIKTKRVGIRVTCDGIRGFKPKNDKSKTPTPATTSSAKCKVDLRIKIWKFTF